jgi:hypothetical protein
LGLTSQGFRQKKASLEAFFLASPLFFEPVIWGAPVFLARPIFLGWPAKGGNQTEARGKISKKMGKKSRP